MEDARRFLQQQKAKQFLEKKRAETNGNVGLNNNFRMPGKMMQLPGQMNMPGGQMKMPGGPRLMSSMLEQRSLNVANTNINNNSDNEEENSSNVVDEEAEELKRKIALLEQQLVSESNNEIDNSDGDEEENRSMNSGEVSYNTITTNSTSSTSQNFHPPPPPPPPQQTNIVHELELEETMTGDVNDRINDYSAEQLKQQIALMEKQLENASNNELHVDYEKLSITPQLSSSTKINMPKRRHEAAIKLQSQGRKYMARKQYIEKKNKHDKACIIQRHARGKIARKQYNVNKQKYDKATIIQRHARGKLQRQKYIKQKQEKFEKDRHAAASNVQRIARGRKLRKNYVEKQNASRIIQRNIRGRQGRQKYQKIREKENLRLRLAELERRKKEKMNNIQQAEEDTAYAETMLIELEKRKIELKNEYAKLRLRKKKLHDIHRKLTEEQDELDEELNKVIKKVNVNSQNKQQHLKLTPLHILQKLDDSINGAKDRLEDIRANNEVQRRELLTMHDNAMETKGRILKAFGKAMSEIRFQQFQHNALKASVNNMANTLY
jgi:hypothetical protein